MHCFRSRFFTAHFPARPILPQSATAVAVGHTTNTAGDVLWHCGHTHAHILRERNKVLYHRHHHQHGPQHCIQTNSRFHVHIYSSLVQRFISTCSVQLILWPQQLERQHAFCTQIGVRSTTVLLFTHLPLCIYWPCSSFASFALHFHSLRIFLYGQCCVRAPTCTNTRRSAHFI